MTKLRPSRKERSEIALAIKKCQNRISGSLEGKFEYHHLAIARSTKFLRRNDSKRLKMYVLFVDLGSSTKMSSELSPESLAQIIRVYSQEMAYIVECYGGYVLKYVGDAVIGYFPAQSSAALSKKIVLCAQTMVSVISDAINPVLREEGYPGLQIKISVDYGENNVVRYGSDRKISHIDIIGLSINLAAKMQILGKPNQIVMGKQVFFRLPPKLKTCFKKLKVNSKVWPYHDFTSKRPYPVFFTQLYP